jgi:hypothetical protein
MARGAAALALRASWSAHAPGDKLLASKCGGDATMLRVVSSRVVLLGAPFSGCACLRRPELWARSGLELPSREDDNFDPGTRRGATGGSLHHYWHPSRSCPATGPCRSLATCPCAQLASRAARRSAATVCARATQASEPLLCAQQARRGFSAVAPTSICAAFSGGAAAPR